MNLVFFSLFLLIFVIIDYSLNLSRNRKTESKVKMESAFITNDKYYINVYHS